MKNKAEKKIASDILKKKDGDVEFEKGTGDDMLDKLKFMRKNRNKLTDAQKNQLLKSLNK